jgi:hypothetical protein
VSTLIVQVAGYAQHVNLDDLPLVILASECINHLNVSVDFNQQRETWQKNDTSRRAESQVTL